MLNSKNAHRHGYKCSIIMVTFSVFSLKPRRTDEGGSRLLHKAILGLRPRRGETMSSRGFVSRREKVILVPASMLGDHAPKDIVLTTKAVQSSGMDYFCVCNATCKCDCAYKMWIYGK